MGDQFYTESENLYAQIMEKFDQIGQRTQGINERIETINRGIRDAFLNLQLFGQRVQGLVDRIRKLSGLSENEKQRIIKILTAINQRAAELESQLTDLPDDVKSLPADVQTQIQAVNDAITEIDRAVSEAESNQGGPGGPPGPSTQGGPGGSGGGGGAIRRPPGKPSIGLEPRDLGGIDAEGNVNPFVFSQLGKRRLQDQAREAALRRGQSEEERRLLESLPDVSELQTPTPRSRRGGGKKHKKSKKKNNQRKGHKSHKSRKLHKSHKTSRGGYVIPNKRTHSAKGKKSTPVAGKKEKSKKSRK